MRIGLTFDVRLAGAASQPDESPDPYSNASPSFLVYDREEEFDSPETIQALAAVLEGLGHDVDLLGDGEQMLRRLLCGERPDLVLNIAEGCGESRSREARVPAVLEMLGIPYTGSDPLTLAVALDKDCAKRLVAAAGVATPRWVQFTGELAEVESQLAELEFPVIVKPAYEGSSKGILAKCLVHESQQLRELLSQQYQAYHQPLLIEEFIDGDELTVGIVGNAPPQVLGIMRVVPQMAGGPFIYSLEVKRDWQRQVRYECPAQLSAEDAQSVHDAALASWRALGCRDVSRIDFRLRRGVPYFLEANPLPGLSPTSGDLVLLAGHVGIEYPDLIGQILQAAMERIEHGHAVSAGA